MSERRRPGTILLFVSLGGVAVLGTLVALVHRDETVGVGRPIRYDDFAFTVEGVRHVETLGKEGQLRPRNASFAVVTVKVSNEAKRVGFRFAPSMALLRDVEGRTFAPSVEAGRALREAEGKEDPFTDELPAGTTGVGDLAFDVPRDLREPELEFRIGGGPVGNALLFLVDGRRTVAIDRRGD